MLCSITIEGIVKGKVRITKTPSGGYILSFFIKHVKKAEKESFTSYFLVEVFGKVAEAVKSYIKDGDRVLIVGEIRQDRKTKAVKIVPHKIVKQRGKLL